MDKIILTLKDELHFGKFKGIVINNLIPEEDDNFTCFSIFGKGDGLDYMNWIKDKCDNIELSEDIIKRINKLSKKRSDDYVPQTRKRSFLSHYNDIGAMNDLSFQDVYGDFGF